MIDHKSRIKAFKAKRKRAEKITTITVREKTRDRFVNYIDSLPQYTAIVDEVSKVLEDWLDYKGAPK